MRLNILLIFLLLCSFSFAAEQKDSTEKALLARVYKNIERDIILVKKKAKYGTRFKVRLFELYIERFNYLRKRENAIFLESKNINVVKKKKKVLRRNLLRQFKEITALAKKLEHNKGRYARQELGRVFTILSEISRDLNFGKKHLYYLRKASRYVHKRKYRYQVNVFFAEYYYNTKKYKTALKYYKPVLKNRENRWYSKHLYNSSWCYLKLDNFKKAIQLITLAHKTSRMSSYVNLGPQAINHLSLFYAFSGSTKEALRLLPTLTADPYTILIKFSDDTIRFGKKQEIELVFNKIERYVKLPTKRLDYLLHKIKIYRRLTKYNDLQRSIFEVAKIYKKIKKAPVETNEGLVAEIKSYTGLLQERFVKGNISPAKKGLALKRIMKNFDILSLLNPKQTHEYLYFQGETLYGYLKFSSAIEYYKKSISFVEKKRKKQKDSKALIDKRLNSIFSGLERMETNQKAKERYYEYAYQKYLEYFPKTVKAQSMYQKLFTLYFKRKKHHLAIKTITRYNKNFPKDQKFQKSMYDDIMRYYIKRKDASKLTQLIKKPKRGYLGYTKKDVVKFQEILYQIYFTVYDKQLAKKDYKSSISGFSKLFANDKVPYSVRYRAGLKALEIHSASFKNSVDEISSWSVKLMKAGTKNDFLSDRSRFEYIIQMFASNGHLEDSYDLIKKYRKKAKVHKVKDAKLKPVIETQLLLALALEKRRSVIKVFDEYIKIEKRKEFRVAYNRQILNHFKMTGKESYLKGFIKKYKHVPEFQADFDATIVKIGWKEFDKDGNSSTTKRFVLKELRPEQYKQAHNFLREEQEIKKLKQVKFTNFADKPVTFESFSKEIEVVIKSLQDNTGRFDNFMKTAHAKAIIRIVKTASDKVDGLAKSISKYIPKTADKELKKAILLETKKLEQVVVRKKSEYLKLTNNINREVALFDPALFELKKGKDLKDFFDKPVDMKMFTSTINGAP